jgi:O-antigen/teichoic acid export membrane protein
MAMIANKILGGAAWAAFETWGRTLISFLIFVVLARLLSPAEMGLATLALLIPTLLAIPVTSGIPQAIVQRKEIDPLHLDSAFWLLVGSGVLLCLLASVLAGPIARVFDQPALGDLVHWTGALVIIWSVVVVPEAILKRQLQFRLFAIRALIGTVMGGAAGIWAATKGFGVWSIIIMYLVGAIAEALVIFFGVVWRPRIRYSHAHCRQLFGFAAPIIGQTIIGYLNDAMPKVALGTLNGPASVGLYAIARKPTELLTSILLAPINSVVLPAGSRLQDDLGRVNRLFDTTIRVSAIVGFPAFAGFIAICPVVVPFVFGEQWRAAVPATQILMLLGLLRTIDGPAGNTILALGKSGLLLQFHFVYTVLGVLIIVPAAKVSLEVTMAAIVLLNLLLLPIFLYFVSRTAKANVLRSLAIFPKIIAATALMFTCVTIWIQNAPADLARLTIVAISVCIGAPLYAAATFLLLRDELYRIRDMVIKSRR